MPSLRKALKQFVVHAILHLPRPLYPIQLRPALWYSRAFTDVAQSALLIYSCQGNRA
jgi:hypothetical protein